MVESFDKTWSTGEGTGKPLQHSYLENPMNNMKRQKYMALKDLKKLNIAKMSVLLKPVNRFNTMWKDKRTRIA